MRSDLPHPILSSKASASKITNLSRDRYFSTDDFDTEKVICLWLETFHSSITKRNYRYAIDKLNRDSRENILTLSSLFFEEYAKQKLLTGAAPSSIKTNLTIFSSFYSYVTSKAPGFENPVRKFRFRLPVSEHDQVRKIRKRSLTEHQIRIIYQRMAEETKKLGREPLEAFVFKMAINSLMRVSELLSLEAYAPVKEGQGYFNYIKIENGRGKVLVKGKNNRLREFSLNVEVTSYLLAHRFIPGERIFINRRGKPLSRSGGLYLFRQIQKKYMYDLKAYKFSPHSARHTGFTLALKGGDTDPIHLAILGGSSRSVVEKYYCHEAKDVFETFSVI